MISASRLLRVIAPACAMALAAVAALAPAERTARADEPEAKSLASSLRILEVRKAVTELDLVAADKAIEGGDMSDPLLAIERARARLWRLDCEGASAILARPDLEASKDAASLIAVARGCLRAMAGTIIVTDEARGVVLRFQDDEDRALAPYLADVSAKARDVLAKDLGVTLPRPLYVEIVRDQHSLSALTGLPLEAAATTGTVAVAKWGRITMLSPRAMTGGYPWLDTAAHELTHVALTQGSADKAPLWLQEGVAKREETKWRLAEPFDDRPPAHDLAAFGLANNMGPPIDNIGPSIALLPSAEESMVTYAKVQSFIDYFATEAGTEALPKLVTAMKDATDPDDLGPAVQKASGSSFPSWKERWEAWLKAQAKELPAEQKPGAPPPAHWAAVRKHVRLGDLLEARGHHDAARSEREDALALAPTDARVRASLASSLVRLDRRDDARLLVVDPAEVRNGSGRWWSLRGLLVEDDADRARSSALARDPLSIEIACEEKPDDQRPSDPDRAAICDMARRAPREQTATTHPTGPSPGSPPAPSPPKSP
jgi:hypothetical protein